MLVHRLIAQSFIPNPRNFPEVNHKDSNKLNNKIENLEWVSSKENKKHAWERGLYPRGSKRANSKLNEKDVKKIRQRITLGEMKITLAQEYGVSHSLIVGICKRKRWNHVL